jgi:hypothetical protein
VRIRYARRLGRIVAENKKCSLYLLLDVQSSYIVSPTQGNDSKAVAATDHRFIIHILHSIRY